MARVAKKSKTVKRSVDRKYLQGLLTGAVIGGFFVAVGVIVLTFHPKKHFVSQKNAVAVASMVIEESVESPKPLANLTQQQDNLGSRLMDQLAAPPPVNCAEVACMAITFDDGPDPVNTPRVLDELDVAKVKATFFLVGNRIAGNSGLVQRMSRVGHEIGNHSWSHPYFTKLNAQQIQEQLSSTQNAITALGITPPQLFRPPYEDRNPFVLSQIHMPIILWNIDPKDWHEKDPSVLANTVVSEARPGGIVVMHSTEAITAAAIGQIIRALQPNYHLVTVSQLLSLTPTSSGEFYHR